MKNLLKKIDLLEDRVKQLPPVAANEIAQLREQIAKLKSQVQDPCAWDYVQLSRHENRPYTMDYIERLFQSFRPIHGDRKFAEDPAIIGGSALLENQPVMVIGHQKGRNTKQRLQRNYGMPKPEGYRKALRLMQMAEKFNRPVLTFIDTPGAYPGIGAEERGQAEAIAYNLRTMALLQVPILVTILGEGGSGGALAIGLGDKILMLENSIYSVISPESCSAILWKDQQHVKEAADCLKLTTNDLHNLGVIDEIVSEPPGGAHNNWDQAATILKNVLIRNLESLKLMKKEQLLASRLEKFRSMGTFLE